MKTITIEEMADFAHTKSGSYNYYDPTECPLAQYAKEILNFADPSVSALAVWSDKWGIRERESDTPTELLITYDKRLEPHLAACLTWEALANSLDQMLDMIEDEEFNKPREDRTYAYDECVDYFE